MSDQGSSTRRSNFKQFFIRGLALLLPTLLTLWIVAWVYGIVQRNLAGPINNVLRAWIAWGTPWTRDEVDGWWQRWALPMDFIGLVIAVAGIYMAGALVGSLVVRRIKRKGEGYIERVPIVGKLYQATKQVTEFLFGSDSKKMQYSRVVAVEYPRKGMWSVGLVTGKTIPAVEAAGGQALRHGVYAGIAYAVHRVGDSVVPVEETVDLPISTEDAIRFFISGGVIVPEKKPDGSIKPMMLPPVGEVGTPSPTTA